MLGSAEWHGIRCALHVTSPALAHGHRHTLISLFCMKLTPRWWAATLLFVTMAVGACRPEASVTPDPSGDAQGSVPNVSRPDTTLRRTPSSGPTDLLALLESEKARIAARQQAEAGRYDELKVRWQQVLDDTTGAYVDSLMCDPKQYVATTKIVGPEGDDINFGEHTLRIPPGALSARTVITAEAPTSIRVLAVFSPHGTRFNAGRSPTLELSYKHCRGPVNRAARIAYIGANGEILEWPPSQDFPDLGLVRGLIGHFSNYIVAY
jgi:hypothetical protein